jgi:hypothetical protein
MRSHSPFFYPLLDKHILIITSPRFRPHLRPNVAGIPPGYKQATRSGVDAGKELLFKHSAASLLQQHEVGQGHSGYGF